MGRKKSNQPYAGIEMGLSEANRDIIQWDRTDTHWTRIIVEKIVKKIIKAMKEESPAFAKLYTSTFGGGSSYEGLKVDPSGDFDIDILMKIPDITKPVRKEGTIPGYIQLELRNFYKLARTDPELYRFMGNFVDHDNFLLNDCLKATLLQSVFDKVMQNNNYFPGRIITVGQNEFEISSSSVRPTGPSPALTLTIEGLHLDFCVSLDLVPCFLFDQSFWPKDGFRPNPFSNEKIFFVVPRRPKQDHPHADRYFALSFQMQERKIIYDRFWLKPTIRIMKLMNYKAEHPVSSYAIKTLFLWEMWKRNRSLDEETPVFWKESFSNCLIYMLEVYLDCLTKHNIPYFWNKNKKYNLLGNLSFEEIEECRRDVAGMLDDIKENPDPDTILDYLE